MEVIFKGNKTILKNSEGFDVIQTFECGQCFRWNKSNDNSYIGVAHGRVLSISQYGNSVMLYPCSKEDFYKVWEGYFDLKRDYELVKKRLSSDSILKKAISYSGGIRILRQQPWETVISFIISANNNIPRIKGIIERLCKKFGEPIEFFDKTYYSFPTPERLAKLTLKDLSEIRAGFRDKYILDAAKKVYSCQVDLNSLIDVSASVAYNQLLTIKGVGDKVASCIMLFGLAHYEAFPVDVWIRRIIQSCYFKGKELSIKEIKEFCNSKFGSFGGFAQQYLFYYARVLDTA